ncbi:hypothetical protein [Leptolyngbya sp. FACHB-711]|uniref:hypothetical protein n=1 Tax=unclassified Leptolyngbya TaxID=2650499 RepID=UPI001683AC50|nr:hypothetical protein [Leptolyngbya sp. FACHB-711]MBD1852906.1 hypothetical protein [Cyanobacteria bacterium FACHB-502]MBD2023398.1 hypothetical protein [Leptolyngbya sp. FACHB-711]
MTEPISFSGFHQSRILRLKGERKVSQKMGWLGGQSGAQLGLSKLPLNAILILEIEKIAKKWSSRFETTHKVFPEIHSVSKISLLFLAA